MKIDTESCNVSEFIQIALEKEKIELPASLVDIEGYSYISRDQLISSLLTDNSDINPLVLCLCKETTTVTTRVNKIQLSISPSAYGKSSNLSKQKETRSNGRIYQHWLSLEVPIMHTFLWIIQLQKNLLP